MAGGLFVFSGILDAGNISQNENESIRQAERAEILWAVNRITGENAKNLGSLLSRYGFDLATKTRSKKSNAPYVIKRIPASIVEEAV